MRFLRNLFRITPFKLSLGITLLFVALSAIYDMKPNRLALLNTLADKSLDYKFAVRGPQKPKSSKIVIVAGDNKSFTTFGQWPWDRGTVFAPLIDTLCKYNPKAVGFDMVWSEPEKMVPNAVKNALGSAMGNRAGELNNILTEQSGDALLRKAIENCASHIVLGYALQSSEVASADYDRRLKNVFREPHSRLSSISAGKINYSRNRSGNSESNVDFYLVAKSGLMNVPEITPPNVAQGFFNNEQDTDGNYRRATLFWNAGDYFLPSLTLRMAQKALSPTENAPRVMIAPDSPDAGKAMALTLDLDLPTGMRRIPIDLLGQSVVNFRGMNRSFPNVSIADVINSSDTIEYDVNEPTGVKHNKVHKSEFFKDALVLIGMTADAIYDIRPRPFDGQASGVENHANILDNLINDDFLVRPTSEMLFVLFAGIFFGGLLFGYIVSKLDAMWGALFAGITVSAFIYCDQVYLFNARNIVLFGYIHVAQLILQYLSITVLKYMQEENEKKFIRSAFNKYVSPDVIDSMLKTPGALKLGGDKKELSIMFSDIRGFTELSERVDVKALTQFLNEYLGAMTDILQANRGTLDKYIGDAVMGFWGAPLDTPEHASLAVKTAVEMMIKLEELNRNFQEKYGLTIDIGIGVNSGPVSVGNFGSSKVFEYTVIGDNVNLASRLEGINKYYGTHIIISESTYSLLKPGEFLCREVDTVKVKGKHKPVKIYEVFPDNATHAPLKDVLKTFNEGLMHYYARQWEKALALFNTVLQGRNNDKPSLELIDRCKHYMGHPPEQDWDGSWEMHSK